MNIEDFKPISFSLEEIFQKQKEIKFLYEPDAKEIFKNFDIDTYEDQEVFKKYCWRITEELTEAMEGRDNFDHYKEELIDGFNFLMELYMLYGWDHTKLFGKYPKDDQELTSHGPILATIYQLGITANLLKNRQWRKSQYLTDLYLFEPRLQEVSLAYWSIFKTLGMTVKEVVELWSLKYQVNLFRINSNY